MLHHAAVLARLTAGLVLAVLAAPAVAGATHRVALPVSTAPGGAHFLAGSSDGTKVLFSTVDALLPDEDGDEEVDIYLREGGELTLISGAGDGEPARAEFRAATPTLSHVVWETEQNVTSLGLPDIDGEADLYMWSAGQVKRVSGNNLNASNVTPYFRVRISADGGHVVYSATENLGGEADTTADVYEFFGSGVRLLSKNSPGTAVELEAVSTDGTRVFMSTTAAMSAADSDTLTDVYVSVNGAAPVLLTPGTAQNVVFAGISASGSHAYFHTAESLDALLDTDTSRDVYASAVGGDANRLVSAGNGAHDASFQRASADGARVVFTTREPLDPADADQLQYDDIYLRDGATVTLIGATAPLDDAPVTFSDISPDGKHVFWYSGQTFPGDTDGGEWDAWRWTDGVISRISVGEINDQGPYESSYAGRSADSSAFVFQTEGPFTAADNDLRQDLYLRAGGTTTLLTGAAKPCPMFWSSSRCVPVYNGVSADAGRVWFTSDESLHPSDTDGPFDPFTTDLYESRVVGVPAVAASDGVLEHLEGEPQPIDPGLDITEASNDLFGATVRITAGFEPTDLLGFPSRTGFESELNESGDTLTLTGRGTVADFEAALRSVTYATTSETASAAERTIEFRVDNGGHTAADTRTLTVTRTDDPPLLAVQSGAADYTNGAGPVAIADVAVEDPDTPELTGATVRIDDGFVAGEDELAWTGTDAIQGVLSDGGATLTLTGSATVAAYEAVLESVTYANDAEEPTEGPRTVAFTVSTGDVQSAAASHTFTVYRRNIDVANGVLGFVENAPAKVLDDALTITNFPAETITSATVEIAGGFAKGEDVLGFSDQNGIAGTLTSSGDRLTLAGEAPVADYLAALRSVTYRNTSEAPTGGERLIRFSVSGGRGFDTRRVNVVAVDDAPVVAGLGGDLTFTEGGAGLPVAPALTVTDVDSAKLTGAAVRVESGFDAKFDRLSHDTTDGIAAQFDESTGTLTLTGQATPADYQAALRSIVFHNDSDAPTGATRYLTVSARSGDAISAPAGRALHVTPVNDAPALFLASTALTYVTGEDPVAVAPSLDLSDPDSELKSAIVKLGAGAVEGEDVLEVGDRDDGIEVTVDETEQIVLLSGVAPVVAYRTALSDVRYSNRSAAAAGERSVEVHVTDAGSAGATATRTIVLAAAAPEPTTAPTVEGIARVGGTLTGNDGAWEGSEPMTFSRQWQRCASSGCTDIEGATGSSYAPVAADVGSRLQLRVVAGNAVDSVTGLSALTDVVRAALAAPVITAVPPAVTAKDSGVVRFAGEDGATFTCALDGAAFTACASPLTVAGLADGRHRVRVRQHREGLASPEAESTWRVDTTAPVAPALLAGPDATTSMRTASIGFAGEAGARAECALDGGEFAECGSPVSYAGLDLGVHTVLVRSVDSAGNAGALLRVRWTVVAEAVPSRATKLTVRAPASIGRGARGLDAGCALDGGVLERCEVIARVYRGGHLLRVGRGLLTAPAGQASGTVRVRIGARGRRVLRRSARGARIRITAIAREAGSGARLADVTSLRVR
jgi:hypothetical protein